jgi:hypothetical protein
MCIEVLGRLRTETSLVKGVYTTRAAGQMQADCKATANRLHSGGRQEAERKQIGGKREANGKQTGSKYGLDFPLE